MNNTQYLTDEGVKRFASRLSYLREERLAQLLEQIHDMTREGGGFDESPEYATIREEQTFVEAEIKRLEQLLQTAHILEQPKNCHEVRLGSWVSFAEKGSQQQEVYQLLTSVEANPREGRISIESPLGHALLGAKLGDEVHIKVPDGELVFIIKAIY